ncbi:MAG TPA: hypothetical protein VK980_08490 [Sphingomonas sp.]|nr:hypothetical protein [Sphingomonas sp.]
MFRFVIPAALLLVGSAALSADSYRARQEARDAAALAKALDGLTPGKPTSCIDPRRINDTQRIGDKILYKTSRRELYVNDTGGGCFGLRNGDAIVTKSYTGQFCRGDIVQTVDLPARVPSGSCTFGDFVPYRK